jgi:hypothetical protein
MEVTFDSVEISYACDQFILSGSWFYAKVLAGFVLDGTYTLVQSFTDPAPYKYDNCTWGLFVAGDVAEISQQVDCSSVIETLSGLLIVLSVSSSAPAKVNLSVDTYDTYLGSPVRLFSGYNAGTIGVDYDCGNLADIDNDYLAYSGATRGKNGSATITPVIP